MQITEHLEKNMYNYKKLKKLRELCVNYLKKIAKQNKKKTFPSSRIS